MAGDKGSISSDAASIQAIQNMAVLLMHVSECDAEGRLQEFPVDGIVQRHITALSEQ